MSGSGASALAQRLDTQNPWPGLDAFDESGREFFHGRDEEVADLLRKVREAPLTVVFGKSGLGKTSLLRAGLFPRLRDEQFFPVYVRLALRSDAPSLVQQIQDRLRETLTAERIDAPAMRENESLWAYLHRADLEFWNARNFPVTPVFVLDQFEEVFTLGANLGESIARLRNDLGDLAENRIPEALKSALSGSEAQAGALQLRRMPYKLLLSLREDFLPELESWRAAMPSLAKVRFRLLPMRPDQALAAVAAARTLVDEPVARRIVDFVAAAAEKSGETALAEAAPDTAANAGAAAVSGAEIEPALLSLFCRGLNEARKKAGKDRIDDALLEGAKHSIIGDYYSSCFDGMPDTVSRFVEAELITEKGFRNSYARDDAVPEHMSAAQLERLVNMRLLRIGESYGAQRIELTHDLLTRVVREQRDRHRQEALKRAAEQRAAAEREQMQREARERETQLEAQRQKEREEHLRSEAIAGRRFKMLAIGLAIVLGIAALAFAVALAQWRSADRERLEAQRQRKAADSERVEADRQRALAQERLTRITDGLQMKQAVLSGDRGRIQAYLRRQSEMPEKIKPLPKPGPVTDPKIYPLPKPGPATEPVPEVQPAQRTPAIRFTARADDLGYKNPSGQRVYKFSLMPDPAVLQRAKKTVAVITYRMDHPSFQNGLLATGPERDFTASYIGWGCLSQVVVLVEYIEPDRPPEIAEYNMCAALGW